MTLPVQIQSSGPLERLSVTQKDRSPSADTLSRTSCASGSLTLIIAPLQAMGSTGRIIIGSLESGREEFECKVMDGEGLRLT